MHSSNPIITVAVTVAHARDNVHGRREGASALKISRRELQILKLANMWQVSINPRHTKPINTFITGTKRVAYV